MVSGQLQAIIWDMDGVLIDTGPYHFEAWVRIHREYGQVLTEDKFSAGFGLPNEEVIPFFLGVDPGEEGPIGDIGDKKEGMYRDLLPDRMDPMPGVLSWLETLRERGMRLAVATTAPRANMVLLLKAASIGEYFDVTVCDEDVARGKPDPEVYRLAAQRIGVAPEGCLVIEDSLHGIQAAKSAGMQCLAVASTRPASDLPMADHVTPDLGKLPVEAFVGR